MDVKIIYGTITIIIILIILCFMCISRREKYNSVPPVWNFMSLENTDNKHEKCYGKKWIN